MNDSNRQNGNRRDSRVRAILFRLAAVCLVLSPLLLTELCLRLFFSPPPLNPIDPFLTFKQVRPLFVLNDEKTRYRIPEERLAFFAPQSFPAHKGKHTFRIFCLGGSTVQGRPYSVETSFSSWLRLNLEAADPSKTYEVINCGGVSYASYRVLPILREVIQYQPDLLILYTGHNEFLEDRTYREIKQMPDWLASVHYSFLSLRGYALAYHYLQKGEKGFAAGERNELSAEVTAILDYREGIQSYHRDAAWRRDIIAHFSQNLKTMIRLARYHKVPLILANPVSDIKDTPPFKSEYSQDSTKKEKELIQQLCKQADFIPWNEPTKKIELFKQAVALDARHAGHLFTLGKCYETARWFREAKQWYLRAKDEDICPLRILEPMHERILDVAESFHVPLIDVRQAIEERTPDRIPGDEWLLDHVHPTIEGHQLIADLLFFKIQEFTGIGQPRNWEEMRRRLWQSHLTHLNNAYFEKGLMRLKRLEEWSRGWIPNRK